MLRESAQDVINRVWQNDIYSKKPVKIDEGIEAYQIGLNEEDNLDMPVKINYLSIDAISRAVIG